MKRTSCVRMCLVAFYVSSANARADDGDQSIVAIAPMGMSERDLGRPYSGRFEPLIGKEAKSVFPDADPACRAGPHRLHGQCRSQAVAWSSSSADETVDAGGVMPKILRLAVGVRGGSPKSI